MKINQIILKILKRRFLSKKLAIKVTVSLLYLIILLVCMNRILIFINEKIDMVSSTSEHRFIMYRCDRELDKNLCGGFGDRLKGILSAYLWSLLTNRTFLLRVTKPCNMVTLLEPNEVDWNREINISWWHTVELNKK
jgi:hypothetical protein